MDGNNVGRSNHGLAISGVWATLCAVLFLFFLSPAYASKYGQYGPFDYYDPPKHSIQLVERAHLGPKTELLAEEGRWCRYFSDLDYTLRAFPNHPKGLVKMSQFLEHHAACNRKPSKKKKSKSVADIYAELEEGAWRERTPEYYFDRAIKYRSQYAETHILYGRYLFRKHKLEKSEKEFLVAANLINTASQKATTNYYMSLINLEKGDCKMAKQFAGKSYKSGYDILDLKEKIEKSGACKPE